VTPETIHAAGSDLTAALAAARESAHYNRSLIEACPDPLTAVGADGQITDVNDAWLKITGIPRGELIGSSLAIRFSDPELARTLCREAFVRGPLRDYPVAIRDASGNSVHLLCDAAPYRNLENQVAGILLIAHDVSRRQQREDDLARIHADMIVYMEELKQREAETRRINELYEILQTCNSEQEAYPIIGSVATQLFPGTSGTLAVSVSRIHQMETVEVWGEAPRTSPSFLLDDCWALRRGQMLEVTDPRAMQTCRHFQSAPDGPYICLPLTVRGDLQGLLSLRGAPGQALGPQHRQLLTTLGEVIKLSLSNLKLRAALRTQAIRDSLTGLFNRNYLDETLRRELSRSTRRKSLLCLAMLDIDGFKGFNDTYSHHAGDALLKSLGDFFLKKVRTSDIVCRYGGDEFVLVLPDTGLLQVLERLDCLRSEVKSMECRYEGRILPAAAISIGVAQWPDHGASPEDLMKAADHALYSAKHGGRDQVGVFGTAAHGSVSVPDSTGGRSR
jgi:diguanylate cyclase (GGDEF)-like protein/PAS domain S-box-containing protein